MRKFGLLFLMLGLPVVIYLVRLLYGVVLVGFEYAVQNLIIESN